MNYKDINEALEALFSSSRNIEELYIENGGEVTEETEAMEAEIKAIADLLEGEGIDSLGRWLKSLEDKKQAIKNEKAKIALVEKAVDNSIDFVKTAVGKVLRAIGKDKAKGLLYSFSTSVSDTTKADNAAIKELYHEQAKQALLDAGIPAHITCTLGASSSLVPEGEELPAYFTRTIKETAKFTKPRNVKE